MSSLELKITGTYKHLKGPGSRAINKMLEEKVVPVIMEVITIDVHAKAVEYASGVSSPEQRVPHQADHSVGRSPSGYNSTGALVESIKITKQSVMESTIATPLEYAPWLEWGTGLWGPRRQLIYPTKGSLMVFPFQGKTIAAAFTEGQRPQPFFRGSIWYIIDNFSPTKEKIEQKLKGKL